jgi:hypothetical protein
MERTFRAVALDHIATGVVSLYFIQWGGRLAYVNSVGGPAPLAPAVFLLTAGLLGLFFVYTRPIAITLNSSVVTVYKWIGFRQDKYNLQAGDLEFDESDAGLRISDKSNRHYFLRKRSCVGLAAIQREVKASVEKQKFAK